MIGNEKFAQINIIDIKKNNKKLYKDKINQSREYLIIDMRVLQFYTFDLLLKDREY